jgi:hypothetical protein
MNFAKISGVEGILKIEGIGIIHILEKCHRLNVQVCEADPKLRPTMEEFMSRCMVGSLAFWAMRCRQSFLEHRFPQEGRLVLTGLWTAALPRSWTSESRRKNRYNMW